MIMINSLSHCGTCLQGVQTDGSVRRVPILLAGANCTGDETALNECQGSGLGGSTLQCGLRNIVSLICYSNRDPGEPAVACYTDGACEIGITAGMAGTGTTVSACYNVHACLLL